MEREREMQGRSGSRQGTMAVSGADAEAEEGTGAWTMDMDMCTGRTVQGQVKTKVRIGG